MKLSGACVRFGESTQPSESPASPWMQSLVFSLACKLCAGMYSGAVRLNGSMWPAGNVTPSPQIDNEKEEDCKKLIIRQPDSHTQKPAQDTPVIEQPTTFISSAAFNRLHTSASLFNKLYKLTQREACP